MRIKHQTEAYCTGEFSKNAKATYLLFALWEFEAPSGFIWKEPLNTDELKKHVTVKTLIHANSYCHLELLKHRTAQFRHPVDRKELNKMMGRFIQGLGPRATTPVMISCDENKANFPLKKILKGEDPHATLQNVVDLQCIDHLHFIEFAFHRITGDINKMGTIVRLKGPEPQKGKEEPKEDAEKGKKAAKVDKKEEKE